MYTYIEICTYMHIYIYIERERALHTYTYTDRQKHTHYHASLSSAPKLGRPDSKTPNNSLPIGSMCAARTPVVCVANETY
jgi:hypothetical protein